MSANEIRDQLADLIDSKPFLSATYCEDVAAAIIAEGWRPPARVIAAAWQLDALPELSIVVDDSGDASQKRAGQWCGHEMAPLDSAKLAKYGPLTVVYAPEPEPDECPDCGADISECECPIAPPFTTVYLPGDAPTPEAAR